MIAHKQKISSTFIRSFLMIVTICKFSYIPAVAEWNDVNENGITKTTHTSLKKETCRIVWSKPRSQKPCDFLDLTLKTDGSLEIGFNPVGLHTGSYTFRINKFREEALISESKHSADVIAFAHVKYQQPYDTVKWQKVKGSCKLVSTYLRCDVITPDKALTIVHDFKTHSPQDQELFHLAYLGNTWVDFSLLKFE